MAVSEEKLYKKIPMEFNKHGLQFPKNDVVALYEMKKPSNLDSTDRQLVRLDLKNKGDMFQIEVMHKIRHQNILCLEGIQEMKVGGQSLFVVFVEPHGGPLICHLKRLVGDKATDCIPSESFRDLVRQMVLTVEVLRVNGLYHGNISVKNTYCSTQKGVVIIKFANFCKKDEGTDLEAAQLHDWVGLGRVLAYISNAAKAMNNKLSCLVIDSLSSKLQALTDRKLLPSLKNETLSDPFFWDPRKRANFYIHDLQMALKDAAFVARVKSYAHWQLPWDSNPHDGLIAAMNAYRKEKLGKKDAYDGQDPVANLKCMSGAYTHQEELVGKIVCNCKIVSVDDAIQKNQPNLCLTLYRMWRGQSTAEEEAAAAAAEGAAAAGDAEPNDDMEN